MIKNFNSYGDIKEREALHVLSKHEEKERHNLPIMHTDLTSDQTDLW